MVRVPVNVGGGMTSDCGGYAGTSGYGGAVNCGYGGGYAGSNYGAGCGSGGRVGILGRLRCR